MKQFLVKYCVEQKLAGYVMVPDPLAIFYEALCVGLDWDEDPFADDFFQQSPTNSGTHSFGLLTTLRSTCFFFY